MATRVDVDTSRPRPSHDLSLPVAEPTTGTPLPADYDLESYDDYDDGSKAEYIDSLRSIPSVIVEMVGDAYEVSRLRDNGTTVACVMWTRAELEELRRRIDAALEMSK
jgi:hypothetical protein